MRTGLKSRAGVWLLSVLALARPDVVWASQDRIPGEAANQEWRAELLDSLGATIRAQYVFDERVEEVTDALNRLISDGRFDQLTQAELAAELTTAVRTMMSNDDHFRVLAPTSRTASMVRGSTGNGSGGGLSRAELERRAGYYLRYSDRLPGNVFSFGLEQFPIPSDEALAAAAGIMELASSADAIILDLRLNFGGSEGFNQYIASHFFSADTALVLYSRYAREDGITRETRVIEHLPARRSIRAPLYVLVDGGTVSAAENLAYTLQQHGRAVVVGATTRGAANSSRVFNLPGGFLVQMPVARVIHPVSGDNWEGRGVVPDILAPDHLADHVAYRHALETLSAAAQDESTREELDRALALMLALESTLAISDEQAAEYVGTYGIHEVRHEVGRLVVQVTEPSRGATLWLRPSGPGAFELEGLPGVSSLPARFVRDDAGRVVAYETFSTSLRAWRSFPRGPSEGELVP